MEFNAVGNAMAGNLPVIGSWIQYWLKWSKLRRVRRFVVFFLTFPVSNRRDRIRALLPMPLRICVKRARDREIDRFKLFPHRNRHWLDERDMRYLWMLIEEARSLISAWDAICDSQTMIVEPMDDILAYFNYQASFFSRRLPEVDNMIRKYVGRNPEGYSTQKIQVERRALPPIIRRPRTLSE